jgi:antirestriction protein ArdC
LVAEIDACCAGSSDNSTIDKSAGYIDSWVLALKNDYRFVLKAAAQAQKTSDFILGVLRKQE